MVKTHDCRYTGDLRPRFGTEWDGSVFQTDVYLPGSSPVKKAEGSTFHKKSLAVASACLAAIKALHQVRGLSSHFQGCTCRVCMLEGEGCWGW
jgi:hypothetical protein